MLAPMIPVAVCMYCVCQSVANHMNPKPYIIHKVLNGPYFAASNILQ